MNNDALKWSKTRERLLNSASGTVKAADFLRWSFGDQPINGLELVNIPDYDVTFKGMATDTYAYLSTALKTIGNPGWLTIGLATFGQGKWAAALLAYKFARNWMNRGGYFNPAQPNVVRLNELWMAATLLDPGADKPADVKAHEFWHALQEHDSAISLSSTLDENRKGMRHVLPEDAHAGLKYLMTDTEAQPRLFTMLSNAYIQHGIMPQNKYELWAFLISQGLTPPRTIVNLAKTIPGLRKALRDFPRDEDYIKHYSDKFAGPQMEMVTDAMKTEGLKFHIWNQVFPVLYGDMLEVMGDRLGMVRMGHTHNVQLREIFMKAGVDFAAGTKDADATQARMNQVADMMRDDDAISLLKQVVQFKPYQEWNKTPVVLEPEAGLIAVRALYARAAVNNRGEEAVHIVKTLARRHPRKWATIVEPRRRGGFDVPSIVSGL
jgi:hypothetical protein